MKKALLIFSGLAAVGLVAFVGYRKGWWGNFISVERIDYLAKKMDFMLGVGGKTYTFDFSNPNNALSTPKGISVEVLNSKQIAFKKGGNILKVVNL